METRDKGNLINCSFCKCSFLQIIKNVSDTKNHESNQESWSMTVRNKLTIIVCFKAFLIVALITGYGFWWKQLIGLYFIVAVGYFILPAGKWRDVTTRKSLQFPKYRLCPSKKLRCNNRLIAAAIDAHCNYAQTNMESFKKVASVVTALKFPQQYQLHASTCK